MKGLTPYFASFEASIRKEAVHPFLQAALAEVDALRNHHAKVLETVANAYDSKRAAELALRNAL